MALAQNRQLRRRAGTRGGAVRDMSTINGESDVYENALAHRDDGRIGDAGDNLG